MLGLCLRGGCLCDWLVMAALRLLVVKGLFSAWWLWVLLFLWWFGYHVWLLQPGSGFLVLRCWKRFGGWLDAGVLV